MRKWLISMRKAKNLTQNEIAKMLGVDQSFYSQIETKSRYKKELPLSFAAKLAELLGMTLDDIRKEEEALKNAKC